jgi:hypothetical protein
MNNILKGRLYFAKCILVELNSNDYTKILLVDCYLARSSCLLDWCLLYNCLASYAGSLFNLCRDAYAGKLSRTKVYTTYIIHLYSLLHRIIPLPVTCCSSYRNRSLMSSNFYFHCYAQRIQCTTHYTQSNI